jgi:hypothetical protein
MWLASCIAIASIRVLCASQVWVPPTPDPTLAWYACSKSVTCHTSEQSQACGCSPAWP